MCASSSSDSNRLCSCTRLRVIWYLRRITVRQSRCSASGTKLKVSSWATRRFTNRSASGKSCLAPAGATIGLRLRKVKGPGHGARSCARPAHRPPVPLQCLPHGSPVLRGRFHHDFLDLALDQPVGERAQFGGAGPDLQPFKVVVTFDLDVGHHDGQHLLVHVNSRDLGTASASPRGSGERASSHQSGSRAIAGSQPRRNDAQLFGQSRTLRIKQLLGLDGSTGSISISPLPPPPFCPLPRFSLRFRGPAGPALTSCGNRPVRQAKTRWIVSSFGSTLSCPRFARATRLRRVATHVGNTCTVHTRFGSLLSARIQPEEPIDSMR